MVCLELDLGPRWRRINIRVQDLLVIGPLVTLTLLIPCLLLVLSLCFNRRSDKVNQNCWQDFQNIIMTYSSKFSGYMEISSYAISHGYNFV